MRVVGLRELLDESLEVTIVGSFSRVGYQVRRRLHGWQDAPRDALDGRTALVTGPTSGLGRATARGLAALGARVILVGRDEGRLTLLASDLGREHGGIERFPTVVADMSSLAGVRRAISTIAEREPHLDVLVDNAGAIHERRTMTAEGLEATFATMVVGPFVLIAGLLPLLERRGGRVISVVSGGMYAQALRLHDLGSELADYDGTLAYARAKRASATLAREWTRRLHGKPVSVEVMHPGWVDTPGLSASLPAFHRFMGPILRTPSEGADTVLWLATRRTGKASVAGLYLDRRARTFDRLPSTRLTPAERRQLWDAVVGMSGGPDPLPDPSARPGGGA